MFILRSEFSLFSLHRIGFICWKLGYNVSSCSHQPRAPAPARTDQHESYHNERVTLSLLFRAERYLTVVIRSRYAELRILRVRLTPQTLATSRHKAEFSTSTITSIAPVRRRHGLPHRVAASHIHALGGYALANRLRHTQISLLSTHQHPSIFLRLQGLQEAHPQKGPNGDLVRPRASCMHSALRGGSPQRLANSTQA